MSLINGADTSDFETRSLSIYWASREYPAQFSQSPPLGGEKQCTDVYIRPSKLHSARRQLVPAAVDWAAEEKSTEWAAKGRWCLFGSSWLMQGAVTCKFILIYSPPVTVLKLLTFRVYMCVHALLCMCVRTCTCVPQHKRQTWISLLIVLDTWGIWFLFYFFCCFCFTWVLLIWTQFLTLQWNILLAELSSQPNSALYRRNSKDECIFILSPPFYGAVRSEATTMRLPYFLA